MSNSDQNPAKLLECYGIATSPAADECGDSRFDDPYRALEDETIEVHAWQRRLNEITTAALSRIDGLDALADEVASHLAADRLICPTLASGTWFWLERGADDAVRAIRTSRLPTEAGEVLVRADELPVDGDEMIDWMCPSPDGKVLAVAVSSHGDEQSVLYLIDVSHRTVIGRPICHVGSAAWLPDSSGLYLTKGVAPAQEQPLQRLYFLEPGNVATEVDAPAYAADFVLLVQVSVDGRYVGVVATSAHPRMLAVYDRTKRAWLEACADLEEDDVFFGAFVGDIYYAVTSHEAPRGRLVAAPLASLADRNSWEERIAESTRVLRTVGRLDGNRLILFEIDETRPILRVVDCDGAEAHRVPLPPELLLGSPDRMRNHIASALPVLGVEDCLIFTGSSVSRPTSLWRYSMGADDVEEILPPTFSLPAITTEALVCDAPGRRAVRYDVICRADIDREKPGPTLIHGYGGFNCAAQPRSYLGILAPWIAAGGTYVFAHLPGDGTFGIDQWRDGRRGHKQRSFDDFSAVSEDLIVRGITTTNQLAMFGASNGGLLASGAVTQRPHLFAAVAILIPMCDMNRLYRERFPEGFRREYGDPRIPEQATWLRAYSPYHGLGSGPYPPTIIVAGDRDLRTHAWHSRKFAAALSAAGGSEVRLRVHANRGHFTAATNPDCVAEWLGFLMDRVGLPVSARDQGWKPGSQAEPR